MQIHTFGHLQVRVAESQPLMLADPCINEFQSLFLPTTRSVRENADKVGYRLDDLYSLGRDNNVFLVLPTCHAALGLHTCSVVENKRLTDD